MKIGCIGCGNMSKSIISGMLGDTHTRFNPHDILVSDISSEAVTSFESTFRVIGTDVHTLAQSADIIILAVKPQNITELASSIAQKVSSDTLLVSILAGVSTSRLYELFGTSCIIRVMPNTAAMVSESASALFTTQDQNTTVADIFSSIGHIVWVQDENEIDIVTALSGSGPAYFYTFFEAMIATAVEMGLEPATAKALCIQTAIGAGTLAKHSTQDIATLRAQVTSKGGTTEAALHSFAHDDIATTISNAMKSALKRAKELSTQ